MDKSSQKELNQILSSVGKSRIYNPALERRIRAKMDEFKENFNAGGQIYSIFTHHTFLSKIAQHDKSRYNISSEDIFMLDFALKSSCDIMCVGDSNTYNVQVEDETNEIHMDSPTYTEFLLRYANKKQDIKFNIFNAGIPSLTTCQYVEFLIHKSDLLPKDKHEKLVIVSLGVNDVGRATHMNRFEEAKGEIIDGLAKVCEKLYEKLPVNPKIYVTGIPLSYTGYQQRNSLKPIDIISLNQGIQQKAVSIGVTPIHLKGFENKHYQEDGFHLNKLGHIHKATQVYETIKQTVTELRRNKRFAHNHIRDVII